MNKTYSFTDKRVLKRLEEVQNNGVKPSRYISDLILADINNTNFTKDDVIKLFSTLLNSYNMPPSQGSMSNEKVDNNADMMDKINSILNMS